MNAMLNMLGLCMRAGRMITGEKACVQAIRSGEARLAVIDAAASANAVKAVSDACRSHEVPLVFAPANELGFSIGKPGRMVAAVTDPSFADRILKLNQQEEHSGVH